MQKLCEYTDCFGLTSRRTTPRLQQQAANVFAVPRTSFFLADWEKYTNPIVNFGLTKGSTETLWEWTNLHISVVIAPHRGTGRAIIWEKTEGPCNCRIEVYGDLLPLAMRQVGGIDLLSTD